MDQMRNALELARSDLMFLMGYNEIPEVYCRRAVATVEYITRTLGDDVEFYPTKQRWIAESEYPEQLRTAFANLNDRSA